MLEFVEGESLSQRLAAGPMPVAEALAVARRSPGRSAAHEDGVIHRDLKPGNVKITPDGRSRCWTSAWPRRSSARRRAPTRDASHSPTITRSAHEAGVILGHRRPT